MIQTFTQAVNYRHVFVCINELTTMTNFVNLMKQEAVRIGFTVLITIPKASAAISEVKMTKLRVLVVLITVPPL